MGSFDTSSEDAARAAASQAYLAQNAETYKAAAATPIADPHGAMMKIMSTKDTPITGSNNYGIPRLNNAFFRDPRNAAKNWQLGLAGEQVRVKFLFAARFIPAFELPPDKTGGMSWDGKGFSHLLKTIDKPAVKFTTEKLNQYNKKRIIQTKHEYGDCKLGFFNTYDDKILKMFLLYYRWYYGDPKATDGAPWLHDEINPDMNSFPFGYQIPQHVTATMPNGKQGASAHDFFSHIEIYQFGNGMYTRFDLINPKIKDFDLDGDEDHHDKGADPTEVKMDVEFEGIVWKKVGEPAGTKDPQTGRWIIDPDLLAVMKTVGIDLQTADSYDVDPKNPGAIPKPGTRRGLGRYGRTSQSSLQKLLGLLNTYNVYRNGGMNGIGLAGVLLGAGRGSSALSPYGSQNFGSYGGYGAYNGMNQMPFMQVVNTLGAFGSSSRGSYVSGTYRGAGTGYGSYGLGGNGSTFGNILSTVGMLGSFGGTNNNGGYGGGYNSGGMFGNGMYLPTGGVGASYDASGYGSNGNLSNAFSLAQGMAQMAGGNATVASTFGALMALGSVTGSKTQNRSDNIDWDTGTSANDSSQGFGLTSGRSLGIGSNILDVFNGTSNNGISYGNSSPIGPGWSSSPSSSNIAAETGVWDTITSAASDAGQWVQDTWESASTAVADAFSSSQEQEQVAAENSTPPEENSSFVGDFIPSSESGSDIV
jgi:hypothetical protein